MLPYRDSRLTYIALGIFFLIVIGYAYFEARGLIFGPSITMTSQITEVHDPFITVKGQAERISSLSMNGKTIAVTEDGSFAEPYLLEMALDKSQSVEDFLSEKLKNLENKKGVIV